MRWVYRHKEDGAEATPGRQICRDMLKTEPNKFLAQLQGMEKDLRNGGPKREQAVAAKDAEAAVAATVMDDGTVGVLELIGRLLGGE